MLLVTKFCENAQNFTFGTKFDLQVLTFLVYLARAEELT